MAIEWKDARTHREPKWPFFGFAPGNYMGKCRECAGHFMGMDKRAYRCLPCAMDQATGVVEKTVAENRLLSEQNQTLRAAITIVDPSCALTA